MIKDGWRPKSPDLAGADVSADRLPLKGWQLAVTGRLASLSRDELATLVGQLGGTLTRRLDTETTHLIVGERTWPLDRQGRLSLALRRVLRRRNDTSQAVQIEVLTESELLRRCRPGEAAGVAGPFTLTELARLTGLAPAMLRQWAASGWLEPSEVVHGVAYYRYAQVAGLRNLAELLAAGVSRRRLARSLWQLRRWLPQADAALVQLVRLAASGRVAVRLASGTLIEPGGQMLLDFDATAAAATREPDEDARLAQTARYWDGWTFEELCDFAIEWEQMGRLRPAAELYEYLLGLRPDDAETWFNYGNTLHALERTSDAAAAFRAAVKHDPQMADAWNNLGVVLEELDQCREAEAAFRQALQLAPDYADARENLDALRAERRNPA